jgi:hypothetical protein
MAVSSTYRGRKLLVVPISQDCVYGLHMKHLIRTKRACSENLFQLYHKNTLFLSNYMYPKFIYMKLFVQITIFARTICNLFQ